MCVRACVSVRVSVRLCVHACMCSRGASRRKASRKQDAIDEADPVVAVPEGATPRARELLEAIEDLCKGLLTLLRLLSNLSEGEGGGER